MNALLLKELRGTLRTRRFFWSFTAVLFLLGTLFLLACVAQAAAAVESPERVGRDLFRICLWTLSGSMLLVLPAFSCTALAYEREIKAFDLLVTTRMTPWQVVWGKFSAAMVYAVLFLAAALPLVQISFLFGGVSPADVLVAFSALLALAATVTAVSLGLSAPFKGTRWPTALAYSVAVLVFGPLLAVLLYRLEFEPPRDAGYWLLELPLLASASLTAFFLVLATRSVQHVSENRAAALRLCALGTTAAFAVLWIGGGETDPASTLLAALVWLAPWILAFSCEAPRSSGRSRKGWTRLLIPGSGPGSLYSLLLGTLLMAVLLAGPWVKASLRCRLEGLALGLSFLLFACAVGSLLATKLKPGTARALLFAWVGLASAVPVCGLFLGHSARAGKEMPPPAWTLPWASPSLAWMSWAQCAGGTAGLVPQWARWGGRPLHHWACLLFAAGGLGAALWAWKRRNRMKAEASKTP